MSDDRETLEDLETEVMQIIDPDHYGWAAGDAPEVRDVLAAVLASQWLAADRARVWDEGLQAGDPYHRRGNPDETTNPYRTAEQASDRSIQLLREIFSNDHEARQ